MIKCAPLSLVLALFSAPSLASAQEEGEKGSAEAASSDTDTSAAAQESGDQSAPDDSKRKLSDRIKSVQPKAFLKKSRIEVFPQFALDLNDPFFNHYLVGAAVGYHLADSAAIELRGGAVIAKGRSGALRFVRQETDSLIRSPPEMKYHADLDFLWAPFYGKISLLGEAILHFDTYATLGPGIFGTDAGVNPAINVGIGQRYFITEWLVARVELRDYVFLDSRNGESDLQNIMVLGFAVSGFFPMSSEAETR